jgi:serine/threonine protein phosphatase 1
MKTWAIGDVHGCGHTLVTLLQRMGPGAADHIIFLGDLIDRGKNHKLIFETLDEIQRSVATLTLIKGNHEQALLDAIEESRKVPTKKSWFSRQTPQPKLDTWLKFGGTALLNEFKIKSPAELPEQIINTLNKTVLYCETEKYLLVHAGFNFNADDIFQDEKSMLWVREFEVDLAKTKGKKVIHGHVPVGLELIRETVETNRFNFIDLDNGCYLKSTQGMGNLVALELNSMNLLVQSNIEKE